jgi:uncharacterized protein involved in oxidation of intracellular sulfur
MGILNVRGSNAISIEEISEVKALKVMLVINDAPYGSEKAYNALRLAIAYQKRLEEVELRIFLLTDGAFCALPNQATPQGFYNIEEMLKRVIAGGAVVEACGTCADARGLKDVPLIEGVKITSIRRMAEWTIDSDHVISF